MDFIDANPFLRAITNDNAHMAGASREYFRKLDRLEVTATTSEAIIAEVVYVLASTAIYSQARTDIRDRLRPLLILRGWHLPDRDVWLRALDVYRDFPQLSFPDSLAVAHVELQGHSALISYDKALDRVPGIDRIEP